MKRMNKKGQGIFLVVFIVIIVAIVFSLWGGQQLEYWGSQVTTNNPEVTGIAGFIFDNLPLMFIFIGVIWLFYKVAVG